MPIRVEGEGDPIALAEARARTFGWRRKTVLVSTPTIAGLSRIEREYLASDQRRYFVPCPHCGEMQWLTFERLRWGRGNPRSVRYHCDTGDEGIEVVRTIRNDLRIEGADPGLARATGQVTSRFADTLLLDDAAGNAAIELEFEYRINAARRLTVTLHEAYLALAKTPIQGPAGIQATFDLRAVYNAADGRMMTVTLRNGVAAYT